MIRQTNNPVGLELERARDTDTGTTVDDGGRDHGCGLGPGREALVWCHVAGQVHCEAEPGPHAGQGGGSKQARAVTAVGCAGDARRGSEATQGAERRAQG